MLLLEILILCSVFFALCFWGTGTDEKNLRNYMSYPDAVQRRIQAIEAYQGKYQERDPLATWVANLVVFSLLFLALGLPIRQADFWLNFLSLLVLGQSLNVFDLLVIDLLWWRHSKRIRFSEIPKKALYQDPQKHLAAFLRALPLYFVVALLDGYLLTLF